MGKYGGVQALFTISGADRVGVVRDITSAISSGTAQNIKECKWIKMSVSDDD